MNKITRNIIIAGIIIIAGLFAYRFFFVRIDEEALREVDAGAVEVGREVLSLLTELRAINLDDSLFRRSDFMSLQDFGVEISPDPVGRRNPFAPIGVSNVGISDSSSQVDFEEDAGTTTENSTVDIETPDTPGE